MLFGVPIITPRTKVLLSLFCISAPVSVPSSVFLLPRFDVSSPAEQPRNGLGRLGACPGDKLSYLTHSRSRDGVFRF